MRLPDHLSRADIGAYMRDLRRHYGLSEQDVSERLHIRAKYVTAIEEANFDAMPGKAYARGYVHTYAEFLGLDADHVVERCFGAELAREVQAHTLPDSTRWTMGSRRGGSMLLVVLVVAALGYFLFVKPADAPQQNQPDVASVPAVPEEYLESMRTQLMPTRDTFDCLVAERALGCFSAQRVTRQWVRPAAVPDMAPAAVEPEALPLDEDIASDETEEGTAEEKPAAKPASQAPKDLAAELKKKQANADAESQEAPAKKPQAKTENEAKPASKKAADEEQE
jgi:hypothetical protein